MNTSAFISVGFSRLANRVCLRSIHRGKTGSSISLLIVRARKGVTFISTLEIALERCTQASTTKLRATPVQLSTDRVPSTDSAMEDILSGSQGIKRQGWKSYVLFSLFPLDGISRKHDIVRSIRTFVVHPTFYHLNIPLPGKFEGSPQPWSG